MLFNCIRIGTQKLLFRVAGRSDRICPKRRGDKEHRTIRSCLTYKKKEETATMDSVSAFFFNEDETLLLFSRHVLVGLVMIGIGAQFDNHLWRLLTCFVGRSIIMAIPLLQYENNTLLFTTWWIMVYFATMWVPHHPLKARFWQRPFHKRQGCIFVTGCDSGMGYTTVVHLAKTNTQKDKDNKYEIIFAGCYMPNESRVKYEKELGKDIMDSGLVQIVPLNVADDKSVKAATKQMTKVMKDKNVNVGLTSMVQFQGIPHIGPVQYMPLDLYQNQYEVNTLGTIRVVQNVLPLIRNRCVSSKDLSSQDVPGRFVFTGTGGGPTTPCPPLLSAYMGSKFALEAFRMCLHDELHMLNLNIQTSMINPGIVKPTMLASEGAKNAEKMWSACEKQHGSGVAKDEFGVMFDHFLHYQANDPGTHVLNVALAAEHALTATYPRSSYKVGIDSKLAPIVGMLPTGYVFLFFFCWCLVFCGALPFCRDFRAISNLTKLQLFVIVFVPFLFAL